MDIKLISSLEKCFIEDTLDMFSEYKQATVFKNEKFTFQVALKNPKFTEMYAKSDIFPMVESEINDYITIKEVSYIPCEIPAILTDDEGVDRTKAGIFPDWVKDLHYCGMLRLPSEQLRTFMVTVDPAGKISGTFDIKVKLLKGVYDKGVKATDEIMLITDGGIIIRTRVSEIPVYGRSASGVIVMRLEEGSTVARFASVDPDTENKIDEAIAETEKLTENSEENISTQPEGEE